MMKCGGTSAPKAADEEITDVCKEITGALTAQLGEGDVEITAISYTTQVVAGTNYFVKIEVRPKGQSQNEAKYVHARIFKPLPHTNAPLELVSIKKDQAKDGEISYF